MMVATTNLAMTFKTFASGCVCHTLNIFVDAFYLCDFAKFQEAIDACRDAAREPDSKLSAVPANCGIRWWTSFEQMNVICTKPASYGYLREEAINDRTMADMERLRDKLLVWNQWSRLCEEDAATVFDGLAAYATLLPSLMDELQSDVQNTFRCKVYRNLDREALLCAAALYPALNVAALPWATKQCFEEALTAAARRILEVDNVEDELVDWRNDLLSRKWIASLVTDVDSWWKKHQTCWPCFFALFSRLRHCPASSAGCERLFASHAAILTDKRNRLSDKYCEAQLVLKTFEQCATAPHTTMFRPIPSIPSCALFKLSHILSLPFIKRASDQLEVGQRVFVFFQDPNSLKTRNAAGLTKFLCVLKEKKDESWRVKWVEAKYKNDEEEFFPLLDPWEPLGR